MSKVDLSIVIVSWNTRELLRDCLNSIFSNTQGLILEIIVVDNNSSDDSSLMVSDNFPQVQLIQNLENTGFAVANNQAFPLCTSEYIMLLNPDTKVVDNAISTLIKFMCENSDAGAIGPKVVHPEMRLRVLSSGYQPTLRTVFNQYFGLSSLFPHNEMFRGINLIMGVHDDRVRSVEWISGACLMVRRKVIDQVGPLSTKWFMYGEDMEWCERMIAGGWHLYHLPGAVIEHYVGASSNQNKQVSTMWIRSQRSHFISSKRPVGWRLFCFDIVMVIGMASRALLYGLRSLIYPQKHTLWEEERRRFSAYSSAAFHLLLKG